MSYQISVYFNDSDIYTTKIYGVNGNVNLTKYYGDTPYVATGFSGATKFTATPADGCVFTQWVYRVIEEGETEENAEQLTSTDNPFVFTGGLSGNASIIIRAEGEVESSGGETEEAWKDYYTAENTMSSGYIFEEEVYLPKYTLQVYRVRFEYSGVATFYTLNSGDTIGYLSTEYAIDETTGVPSGEILAQDDDSGSGWDFRFECEVDSYTYYYLYIRHQFGDTSGYVYVCVEAPTDPSANLPTVEKWYWTVTGDSAVSGSIKTKARNAAINKTATTNFDHRVWDALVDKVWEICDKCRYGWDTYYSTYFNALSTPNSNGEYVLTAEMFNSLRYNIGTHYSTGINEVDTGDIVYGEYFTTIADCINGWIDYLRDNGILAQPT